jgi:hypothetical protein
MKKLLVLLIVLSSIVSYGQDRINKQAISWDEVSIPFTSAVGWQYSNSEGKWKSQINCICEKVEIKYEQHFFDLQIKSVTYNGKKYFILIQKKRGVDWEYPSIGRGFRTYVQHIAFLFKDGEYEKLKSLQDTTTINLFHLAETGWYEVTYEKVNVDKYIRDSIREHFENMDKGETLYESSFYTFKMNKTKNLNKDVIRFLLPEASSYSYSDFDITKTYFETPSINQLLTLNKIK